MSRMSAAAASDCVDVHVEVDEVEVDEVDEVDEVNGVDVDEIDNVDHEVDARSSAKSSAEPIAASKTRSRAKSKAASLDGSAEDDASDTASMSDEELLAGLREQSEQHFSELYNRYFQRIYSFVFTRLRNHAETEEVVQETFLAVFRSFEHYRGQSSLLSWIYGIAKNTANNSIRRAKSQNERIELADEEDLVPRASLSAASPGEQLDLHRFREALSQRLDGLADWQTEIFEMRHFENLSIPEISKRTTRSSDAVRSSLYRVKRIFFEAANGRGQHAPLTIGDDS